MKTLMTTAAILLAMQPLAVHAQEAVAEGALKGKSATFVSYGGIYQEAQLAAVSAFAKHSGLTIHSDGPTEIAKLQAQIAAGNVMWDVVDVGDLMPYVHCGTLFQKLDFSRIDTSKVPAGQVGECSVPAMNYAAVLVYNADTYGDNPPTGWADFFDTEKFPGLRGVPGFAEPVPQLVEVALLQDGVAKADLYPADIDRGLNKLRSIRDDLVFWTTGAQSQQMLESGEVDMAIVWTGRGMAAQKNGANFKPVWNDWIVTMDQLTIPVGSKNVDAAYALINAYLSKDAQEILSEATSYSPVHLDAQPKVDEIAAVWMTNTPEKQATVLTSNIPYWVENNVELTEKWGAFITGN